MESAWCACLQVRLRMTYSPTMRRPSRTYNWLASVRSRTRLWGGPSDSARLANWQERSHREKENR